MEDTSGVLFCVSSNATDQNTPKSHNDYLVIKSSRHHHFIVEIVQLCTRFHVKFKNSKLNYLNLSMILFFFFNQIPYFYVHLFLK